MSESTCGLCGAQRPAEATFCPSCGARVGADTAAAAAASPPGAARSGGLRPSDLSHQLALVLGDGYEVRGLVGRGGFAEVYEIYDRALSRRLAVKVLRPDIAWTPGMLARFKEECRVLASLNHPNILPIHFIGEGHGLTYYVMPYVEGQSLGDQLRAFGALDTGRALDIAVPILEALGHAHAAGMLHRDIKPDNILIDHGSGRALLVDFGIAKRLDQEAGMTQTGFVVGTPQYMSPEQALGQAQLDARSDIYAFGAMLFQMVTGAPPYDGDSSQEIVGKHIAEPVPQPTDRDARVPVWLSDVIVKCLAKRPVDRFQSVAQVLDAIHAGRSRPAGPTITADQVATRVSSGQLVAPRVEPAKPASPPPPLMAPGPGTRTPEPPKVRVGVIAAFVLVLAGGGIGWYLFGRPLEVPIANQFDVPIRVVAPSGDTVTVAPGETSRIGIPSSGFARLPWAATARSGPDGRPMGQAPSGELSLRVRRGQAAQPIGLAQTRAPMFEPLITNASSSPIELIVNYGLGGAARCDCTIQPGAVRQPIGFYPLYRNTTVRAITASGKTATFQDLGPQVDGSFRVGLRFEDKDFR